MQTVQGAKKGGRKKWVLMGRKGIFSSKEMTCSNFFWFQFHISVDSLAAVYAEISLSTSEMQSQPGSCCWRCCGAALDRVLSINDAGKTAFMIGWCEPISSDGAWCLLKGVARYPWPMPGQSAWRVKVPYYWEALYAIGCCWQFGVHLS